MSTTVGPAVVDRMVRQHVAHGTRTLASGVVFRGQGSAGQLYGIKWLIRHELLYGHGGIFADDVGMGKTLMMLTMIHARSYVGPTLIVVPKAVVDQWQSEIKAFFPSTKVVPVVAGSSMIRNPSSIRDKGPDIIVLTTYSMFQRRVPVADDDYADDGIPPCFSSVEWGRVVLDEGHTIKNERTIVSKSLYRLRTRYRWVMSATPQQNKAKELHALHQFATSDENAASKRPRPDASEIRKHILRRNKSMWTGDAVVLPIRPENDIIKRLDFYKDIPLWEQDIYNHAYLAKLESGSASETLAANMRLRMVCGDLATYYASILKGKDVHEQIWNAIVEAQRRRGAVIKPEYINKPLQIASTKIIDACDFATNEWLYGGKRKTLIFCEWTVQIYTVSACLASMFEIKMGVKPGKKVGVALVREYSGDRKRMRSRDRDLANFKDPMCGVAVLVLQMKSGSVGLNLQEAANIVMLHPDYNPAMVLQGVGRIWRINQMQDIKILRYELKGTRDTAVYKMQQKKIDSITDNMQDSSFKDGMGVAMKETFADDDVMAAAAASTAAAAASTAAAAAAAAVAATATVVAAARTLD